MFEPGPQRFNIHRLCMCVWVKQLVAKAHTGGGDKAAFHILSLPLPLSLYLNIAAPACFSSEQARLCVLLLLHFSVIIPTVGQRPSKSNLIKRHLSVGVTHLTRLQTNTTLLGFMNSAALEETRRSLTQRLEGEFIVSLFKS